MSRALYWFYVERIGFAGVLLIAFLLPITTSPFQILFPICAGITLVTPVLRRRLADVFQQPTVQALLGLMTVLVLGLTYTESSLYDGLMLLKKYSRYFTGILLFPYFVNAKRRELALNAFLLAIGVTVLASYTKVILHLPIGTQFHDGSVFKDHIQTSFCLLTGLLILFYRVIYQREWRWLYSIAISLILIQLFFLCAGRSGYLLFGVLAIIALFKRYRWRGLFYGTSGIAILALSLYQFSALFHERLADTQYEMYRYQYGYRYTSTGERFSYLTRSLLLIKQHPFIGTGTGSFKQAYESVESVVPHRTENPHNEYLHLTVQLGIPGLLALLALFAAPWYQCAEWEPGLRFLLRGMILIMAAGCFINSWLLDSTEGHVFILMLAIFCGVKRSRQQNESASLSNAVLPT